MSGKYKPVVVWLFTGAVLVFAMTTIGGITRLTESGLSIVRWDLITGIIPPLTEQEWQYAFEQYKKYPEYRITHSHFTLSDFKAIYFWEYVHRLLGRVIGLVFLIPFAIFIYQKRISWVLFFKLLLLLLVGAIQGFLGWYMVSSGLVNEPRVSHFRLASHLLTAFFTISFSVWLALDIVQANRTRVRFPRKLYFLTWLGLCVLVIQILFGAFVAGKDAGMIHNYWPHMNPGEFISPEIWRGETLWHTLFNHPSGIQFMHRYLAYVVIMVVGFLWIRSQKLLTDIETRRRFSYLLAVALIQFSLGVFTLLYHVPVWIALLHQLGALLLLLGFVYVLSWYRSYSLI